MPIKYQHLQVLYGQLSLHKLKLNQRSDKNLPISGF